MAYSCKIFLKSECDGCGLCDEPGHGFKRVKPMFDDDTYDPFEIDYDDERE